MSNLSYATPAFPAYLKNYPVNTRLDLIEKNDGAITTGTKTFTSASASFTTADVGKYLTVFGAGPSGYQLGGTIAAFISSTSVTVQFSASNTVTGARWMYGTNNSAALQTAVNTAATAGGGIIELPAGDIFMATNLSGVSKNNIWIRGKGIGSTNIILATGCAPISFGTGDASLGVVTSNIRVTDLTVDMNNCGGGNLYGLVFACCQDVTVQNVHVKNQSTGALGMLFFGLTIGGSDAILPRNLTVIDSIFSDSTADWEMMTLGQAMNIKVIGCTFRNKTQNYGFLNYNSRQVSVVGCTFIDTGNGVNAYIGDTTFDGCSFNNSGVTLQGNNTTFVGCQWNSISSPSASTNGISIVGFQQSSENSWDGPPIGTNVSITNTKIIGCKFRNANTSAIVSGTFLDSDDVKHLSAEDILIDGCSFESTYWQGISVTANYLTIKNNRSYNSGQLGTTSVKFNYAFSGKLVFFENNQSFDNQSVPTATRDYFIDNQNTDVIPTMDIRMTQNDLRITGTPYYYTGTVFTSTKPANITLNSYNADAQKIVNVLNPTDNQDAATKSYVDTIDATAVHIAGTETITGAKTFTSTATLSKLAIPTGTNASAGTATLTAGTVTVNTTAITASSIVFLTVQSLGTVTVASALSVGTITAATSFVINSAVLTDTSVIGWMIIN